MAKLVAGGLGMLAIGIALGRGFNTRSEEIEPPAPITDEASFKLVNGKLATPNSGMLYVNVANAVELADQLGVGSEDEDVRKNIKPIKAVGFAADPGIDQNGTARARMFIYINDQ